MSIRTIWRFAPKLHIMNPELLYHCTSNSNIPAIFLTFEIMQHGGKKQKSEGVISFIPFHNKVGLIPMRTWWSF